MGNSDAAALLGERVRALRRERGLTLKALGRRAGLSHPFLSQLERGLARPSVGSVERIAGALRVPVGALWTPPPESAPRVVRAGDPSPPAAPLAVQEWSSPDRRWTERAETRAGAAVVYVVRGTVEVEVDGRVFALAASEALHFDGALPHRLRRTGPKSTRALYVACKGV